MNDLRYWSNLENFPFAKELLVASYLHQIFMSEMLVRSHLYFNWYNKVR